MPVELIGEVGTAGAEREWIVAQATLAIRHLIKTCGPPPEEMELEIQWQEHDLGEYPTIVLAWEDAMRGAPWEYISRCESELAAYEHGEPPPRWSLPAIDFEAAIEEDDDRDPDLPPEPPDNAGLFEVQRYVSQLIEYGLDASRRERKRPKLVERDDDRECSS
jgi:hypothetical protein